MKPMLAATWNGEPLMFPLLASPKLDGIRALVMDGVVYSRNLKPIPNKFVQESFGHHNLDGLDGELIVGDPTSPTCYRDTMSGVMSADGIPHVKFYVFDVYELPNDPFHQRHQIAESIVDDAVKGAELEFIEMVYHREVRSQLCLQLFEERSLEMGYEGVMLRHPHGTYKFGRSTMREQGLIKVKRFSDAEAVIIGCKERMHNGNKATKDELGRTKRTSHKANKIGRGDLGAFTCKTGEGIEFDIGTGFVDSERETFWRNREKAIGQIVKYRYFPTGSKEAPRFPVFLGFRSEIDA